MVNIKLIQDMSEFLVIPVEKIEQCYRIIAEKYPGYLKWTHVTEEEWLKKNIDQTNEEEIARFYQETSNYIPELVEAWTSDKYRLSQIAINIIKESGLRTVVDYGAGIGESSVMHSCAGLEATAVDLHSRTFDFAKWRFKKYGLHIKTIDIIPEQFPLIESYDVITCFEVLQHFLNPPTLVEHFYEHLNPSGLFIMTARFKGNYALALKENEIYHGRFKEVVESKGFRQEQKIHLWGSHDDNGKYLEVYRK